MVKMKRNDTKSNNKKKTNKKRLKSLLSRPGGAAMKSVKEGKDNPFETIFSRRKFDILGKKQKGDARRIAHSRSLAIEKRKKTLLKEYEQSAKSSEFIDKRIGEHDDSLKDYEKAILRLQRERLSKLKKADKYNLSDEEDDDVAAPLTNSLSHKDDFEEDIPLDEDDIQGNGDLPRNLSMQSMPRSLEANLSDGEEKAHKTKKQVMAEIIEKSKFYKAQKAKEKEEDEELMEKLDKEFASISQTEAFRSLTRPAKFNSLNSREKPDAYDKLVKEMAMESRARPSDRTKTPEELAQEERERLEKLEEERKKRMSAPADESSDDDSKQDEKMPAEKSRSVSGDALGDSFSLPDDTINEKGWIDDIYATNDSTNEQDDDSDDDQDDDNDDEEEENSDGEFGKNMTARDWEQSDEDEPISDPEEEMKDLNEKKKNKDGITQKLPASKDSQKGGGMEGGLPYVIEAPNNLEELCSLLDNRSEGEVLEAISRIRACNSIRLGTHNRKKMQVFYGVLLQYFAVLATRSPINVKIMNILVKPLIEMSNETPFFAAICARQRLIQIRTHLCDDIKTPGKNSWPSLKTMVLLRLWSLTFPVSDFRHSVMTPVLLLMCEYLIRCPVQSTRDLAIGSFLSSLVLSVTKQSRKYCPEVIIFMQTLLLSCIGLENRFQLPSQISQLVDQRTDKPWLCIDSEACEVKCIDLFAIMEMQPDSPYFASDSFRASVIESAAETLKGFIHVYEDFSSFPEIFHPISVLISTILERCKLPGNLRADLQEVTELIKKKTKEYHKTRQPLQLRKQKAEPIRLLNPKFEDNYIKGVDYDPDREKARIKRLKKQMKSEGKGAIRELRKDNYFLSQLKEKKRREEEQERAERYGKAMSFLQEQEHAFKSGQLGKGRKGRG